jgi:site-specific DNA recombinase
MTRAAIYARFSTDLQNERSIDDQAALCRSYTRREGLTVVAVYEDRARSGGSLIGRDGLMRMMEDAKSGAFDVVVVEALDRLSRDMEDLAGLHKRLSFCGVGIRAVNEGVVNTVLVGLRGLVGQLYREDNVQKIRRGMAGRVRQGLAAGGLTYGYRPVDGQPGKREIVRAEAAIVRRIFQEYLAGKTPRAIAHRLNRERVKPPRGARWNASTLYGEGQRGSGILRNELYAGRLVWNKVRMLKDPDTGRRVSRVNPSDDQQIVEIPHLAIITPEAFAAVRARMVTRAGLQRRLQQRPKHLLSGLLRCGACGAGMSAKGRDKSGKVRITCSAALESGVCSDPKTFYLKTIEDAVLDGLRGELKQPAAIAAAVKTYHEEKKRLRHRAVADRSKIERRLSAIDREMKRCIDGYVRGDANAAALGARSKELGLERETLEAQLALIPEANNVVALHPSLMESYASAIDDLAATLTGGLHAGDTRGAETLREIISTVTVSRDNDRRGGVSVLIEGRLQPLVGNGVWPNGSRYSGGLMVAEEGLEPPTHGL